MLIVTLDSATVLDRKPKAQATKEKDKLGYIKIKYSCASNNTCKKVKRQLMQWEKIFENHVSDK